MSQGNTINRRQFARLLAASAAATPVVVADEPAPAAEPAVAELPRADSPAELLLRLVKQQYPDERLSERVLAEIRSDIEVDLSRSRILSAYALKNSDEPAVRLAVYRADDDSAIGERGASAP